MRRTDREVTDCAQIAQIARECDTLHLALNTPDGAPYLLPVSFGMEDDASVFYIHGASEGRKYELLARDARVGFALDRALGVALDARKGMCTMRYESIVGWGRMEEVTDEAEKLHALACIMAHYRSAEFPFDRTPVARTRVFRLTVAARTAKRRA